MTSQAKYPTAVVTARWLRGVEPKSGSATKAAPGLKYSGRATVSTATANAAPTARPCQSSFSVPVSLWNVSPNTRGERTADRVARTKNDTNDNAQSGTVWACRAATSCGSMPRSAGSVVS